jgi:hypothetical protein
MKPQQTDRVIVRSHCYAGCADNQTGRGTTSCLITAPTDSRGDSHVTGKWSSASVRGLCCPDYSTRSHFSCTYRQYILHAHRQTDRQTDRQTGTHTHTRTHIHQCHTHTRTHSHTHTHTHVHTHTHRYMHTHTHTHTHTSLPSPPQPHPHIPHKVGSITD